MNTSSQSKAVECGAGTRAVPVGKFLAAVDATYDALLAKLGCTDSSDADLISHDQGDSYVISVTRKSDGRSLYRVVRCHDAAILPPLSSEGSAKR